MVALRSIRLEAVLQRRFLMALLAVILIAVSVQYAYKVRHGSLESRSAILRWQGQVIALLQGTNIWERYDYPNPPIMALLLSPLMHLPPLACALAWFYLKSLLAILSLHWIFRMVETPERPFPLWGKVLAIALALRPILGDLTHGNVNLFILFLVTAGLYAFYQRRDFRSGLLLGLAIACKLTPALFIPYFLWKRAWRTLAGCALGLVLFLGLVPALFLGMKENAVFLNSWVQRMVRPFVVHGDVLAEHTNQSLPGLAHRLARHVPSFTVYTPKGYVPVEYHNFLDLDRTTVSWFVRACMFGFAIMVVYWCRTPIAERRGWPLLAEFGIVALGMLLFSERTWKHHCVMLVLPFTVLVYYLSACHPPRARKRYLVATLTSVAVLMALTGTTPGIERLGKLAQVYGAYAWAHLLLLAALISLLPWRRGEAAHTPAASSALAVHGYRVVLLQYDKQRQASEPAARSRLGEMDDGEVGVDQQRGREQLSTRGDPAVS